VRRLTPASLAPTGGRYSQIVTVSAGRLVFIAGQTALDSTGQVVGGADFAQQARKTLENVQRALAEVGATWRDVVKMNTYITSVANLPTLRDVRSQFITSEPPASTTVQVASLVRPDLLIEIEAIAAVPR
jgi:reactive intermediate/imine deaminase